MLTSDDDADDDDVVVAVGNVTAQCAVCNVGDFLYKGACEDCPLEGVTCEEEALTVYSVDVQSGYWRGHADSLEHVRECSTGAAACRGGTGYNKRPGEAWNASVEYLPSGEVNGTFDADNYCTGGAYGPMCKLCEKDYAPRPEGGCKACKGGGSPQMVLLYMLGALAVLIGMAVVTAKSSLSSGLYDFFERSGIHSMIDNITRLLQKNRATLKIYTTFFQVIGGMQSTLAHVRYPANFLRFTSGLKFFQLDFASLLSMGCIVAVHFPVKLFALTMTPICISALLAFVALFMPAKRVQLSTAFFAVTFLSFPTVSSTIFMAFACDDQFDHGESYLITDYSVDCHSSTYYSVKVTDGERARAK